MIAKLLFVEILKVRRSMALLVAFACPLMVVALNVLIQLKSKHPPTWTMYWLGNTAVWTYFMYPLYIALVTALLNGNEHKNGTWRVMLSLPISSTQLYFSKLLLAFLFLVLANVVLFVMCAVGVLLLGLCGLPTVGAFEFTPLKAIAILSVAVLPVLLFQHWLSWRFSNIVAPLTAGVIGTMGIMQIGQSKDWVYYPWSYALTAINATNSDAKTQALQLAFAVSCVMSLLTWIWLKRTSLEFK